jgi:nitric oxide reductase NorE protein
MSRITQLANTATSANHQDPQDMSLPGDVGFWTFITADASLFALLFFQFSRDRSSQPAVFDEGQRDLIVLLGTVNTLVLVTSSWLMASAVRDMRRGSVRTGLRLIAGTAALGFVFAAVKISEYVLALRSGHTVSTSPFFMYYFVITGIHLVHLMIGVVVVVVVGWRLRVGIRGPLDRTFLECGAAYWHLVDLLWMFIFPMLYLAR